MSGPKPLGGKEFALRHATPERGNYKLLAVLSVRKFKVRCLDCRVVRVVEHKHGNLGPKCQCKLTYKFRRVRRTPETHTKEIKLRGYVGYTCLSVATKTNKRYRYSHSCGTEFEMTKDCFFGCLASPCPACRPTNRTQHHDAVSHIKQQGFTLKLLEEYVGCAGRILVQYPCGCEVRIRKELLRRTRTSAEQVNRCPLCYPNRVRFEVAGKEFITRSLVEKNFVQWLVDQRKVPINRIEYEPKKSAVSYFDPVQGKVRRYHPDFRVGNTVVEVKDLCSLGVTGGYKYAPQEEVLIENRAKVRAATQAFDDFRVYVKVGDNFIRTERFWRKFEQRRLLSLSV